MSAPLERGDQVTYELVRDGESNPRLRLTGKMGRTGSGALVDEGVVGPSVLPVGRYTVSASLGAEAAPIPTRTFRVEAPRQ